MQLDALDADSALAMIRELAGVDDAEVRAALVACLATETSVAAAASAALGECGPAALAGCVAALRDPARARWAALAIARIGPDARAIAALWRALPTAPAATRMAICLALGRSPIAIPAALGQQLRVEGDDGVRLVLLDALGRAARELDADTLADVGRLARGAAHPLVRVHATWAMSWQMLEEAIAVVVPIFDDPVGRLALVACVARRGGPLEVLVDGWPVVPGLDPVGELLDALQIRGGGRDAG